MSGCSGPEPIDQVKGMQGGCGRIDPHGVRLGYTGHEWDTRVTDRPTWERFLRTKKPQILWLHQLVRPQYLGVR